MPSLRELTDALLAEEASLRRGGNVERQRRLARLTVRERLALLLDEESPFFELGLWYGYDMYEEYGGLPAAGLVAGVGVVSGRHVMVIANDATVKAGAMFPAAIKKMLRAQRLAYQCRLPILYLVDSSGVFLPLQDEIFPDEDDFGRVFRNNAVLSAAGIPQIAAIMGNCIAGSAYLPVLCDQLLMTKGSGLYLAGPALVKAAIGQVVTTEELGGGDMHADISGTVDFLEEDDAACLKRMRALVALMEVKASSAPPQAAVPPARSPLSLYELVSSDNSRQYEVRHLIEAIVDGESLHEYKQRYGRALVTAYAAIGGFPVGIVANQRMVTYSASGALQIGGVIYSESADKAARFVMTCNQMKMPIIFLQDVTGFMVGRDAEHSGIIKSGAKLVNAISNSIVPKLSILIGNSFGAGHYALCGKAYDPLIMAAWPNARYAVMGADQAAATLTSLESASNVDKEELYRTIRARYGSQMDIRYGAARGWVDALIPPEETRNLLTHMLQLSYNVPTQHHFHTGVFQV